MSDNKIDITSSILTRGEILLRGLMITVVVAGVVIGAITFGTTGSGLSFLVAVVAANGVIQIDSRGNARALAQLRK